jgi:hypothetical protein
MAQASLSCLAGNSPPSKGDPQNLLRVLDGRLFASFCLGVYQTTLF